MKIEDLYGARSQFREEYQDAYWNRCVRIAEMAERYYDIFESRAGKDFGWLNLKTQLGHLKQELKEDGNKRMKLYYKVLFADKFAYHDPETCYPTWTERGDLVLQDRENHQTIAYYPYHELKGMLRVEK